MDKQLRIGIPELEKFNPQRGIGRAATTMIDYWRRWGHQVVSLTARKSPFPLLRNMNWGFVTPFDRIDVILFPDLPGAESLFFHRRNPPCVAFVNDVGVVDSPADRSEATYLTGPRYRLAMSALRRFNKVLTISDFTRQRLLQKMPDLESKTSTVHYGVDKKTFRPQERQEVRRSVCQRGLPLQRDDFLIIYVGAEYSRKNLPALIEGLAKLKTRLPQARLLKVGQAHKAANRARTIAAIASAGLDARRDVIFVDQGEDVFLAQLYAASDVFVTMSTYEGFGLPLLEAMACGLPAVVSRAGSLPEVGGDAADYIDPDDPAALAARLLDLAKNPPERPIVHSLDRAAHFSWERAAHETLSILEHLVRTSPIRQDDVHEKHH